MFTNAPKRGLLCRVVGLLPLVRRALLGLWRTGGEGMCPLPRPCFTSTCQGFQCLSLKDLTKVSENQASNFRCFGGIVHNREHQRDWLFREHQRCETHNELNNELRWRKAPTMWTSRGRLEGFEILGCWTCWAWVGCLAGEFWALPHPEVSSGSQRERPLGMEVFEGLVLFNLSYSISSVLLPFLGFWLWNDKKNCWDFLNFARLALGAICGCHVCSRRHECLLVGQPPASSLFKTTTTTLQATENPQRRETTPKPLVYHWVSLWES